LVFRSGDTTGNVIRGEVRQRAVDCLPEPYPATELAAIVRPALDDAAGEAARIAPEAT